MLIIVLTFRVVLAEVPGPRRCKQRVGRSNILIDKDFRDLLPKGTCTLECQSKVGMNSALLNGVNRLARHTHMVGKICPGAVSGRIVLHVFVRNLFLASINIGNVYISDRYISRATPLKVYMTRVERTIAAGHS
jgi:hypothetical protein